MRFVIHSVKGQKPTKKNPNAPKITAKEALETFLNDQAGKKMTIVSIMPAGFGGYQVVTCE